MVSETVLTVCGPPAGAGVGCARASANHVGEQHAGGADQAHPGTPSRRTAGRLPVGAGLHTETLLMRPTAG